MKNIAFLFCIVLLCIGCGPSKPSPEKAKANVSVLLEKVYACKVSYEAYIKKIPEEGQGKRLDTEFNTMIELFKTSKNELVSFELFKGIGEDERWSEEMQFAAIKVVAIPIINTNNTSANFSAGTAQWASEIAVKEKKISQEEADLWLADIEEKAAAGEYFFCVNRFLFSAVKMA